MVHDKPPREQLVSRYAARRTWIHKWFRPPAPVYHNPRETGLPAGEGLRIWIGGAGQHVPAGFVNVDLVRVPGVDIVADIEALPFASGSVTRIECDAVLEHVRNSEAGVREMFRVLMPGGLLHVVVPFCHPVHLYPGDYRRWTIDGLRELLSDFELLDAGVRTGPTATLLTVFLEYLRIVSPKVLQKLSYGIAAWLLWPARYLDALLFRRPNAHVLANSIYILARKP